MALPRATRTFGPSGLSAAGGVRGSKRDTSPPVEKVDFLELGRAARDLIIAASSAGSSVLGSLISPEAMASSNSAVLSASERSERLKVPNVCATAIFSAIFGVASSVTSLAVLGIA